MCCYVMAILATARFAHVRIYMNFVMKRHTIRNLLLHEKTCRDDKRCMRLHQDHCMNYQDTIYKMFVIEKDCMCCGHTQCIVKKLQMNIFLLRSLCKYLPQQR